MENKVFENVKDQIGSCGIWCGSCVAGNGAIRELTRRYEEIITAYGLEKWAPNDFDYGEFSKGLASIQRMPLCQGCLKGGGRDDCEMKTCVISKGIQNCLECEEQPECKHIEILELMRSSALDAGLFVKTGQADQVESLEHWMSRLKSKWPCCILFKND
jgi:hypothetical protein